MRTAIYCCRQWMEEWASLQAAILDSIMHTHLHLYAFLFMKKESERTADAMRHWTVSPSTNNNNHFSLLNQFIWAKKKRKKYFIAEKKNREWEKEKINSHIPVLRAYFPFYVSVIGIAFTEPSPAAMSIIRLFLHRIQHPHKILHYFLCLLQFPSVIVSHSLIIIHGIARFSGTIRIELNPSRYKYTCRSTFSYLRCHLMNEKYINKNRKKDRWRWKEWDWESKMVDRESVYERERGRGKRKERNENDWFLYFPHSSLPSSKTRLISMSSALWLSAMYYHASVLPNEARQSEFSSDYHRVPVRKASSMKIGQHKRLRTSSKLKMEFAVKLRWAAAQSQGHLSRIQRDPALIRCL